MNLFSESNKYLSVKIENHCENLTYAKDQNNLLLL
jgi:hypothetical protein